MRTAEPVHTHYGTYVVTACPAADEVHFFLIHLRDLMCALRLFLEQLVVALSSRDASRHVQQYLQSWLETSPAPVSLLLPYFVFGTIAQQLDDYGIPPTLRFTATRELFGWYASVGSSVSYQSSLISKYGTTLSLLAAQGSDESLAELAPLVASMFGPQSMRGLAAGEARATFLLATEDDALAHGEATWWCQQVDSLNLSYQACWVRTYLESAPIGQPDVRERLAWLSERDELDTILRREVRKKLTAFG
jgi:hypothetical protein